MSPATEMIADGARLMVRIPMKVRRRGGRKVVIAPHGAVIDMPRPQVDRTLVKAIARAYRWQRLLEEGTYASMRDLAAAEQISPTYVSRLLRLTLLAPDIVEKVLNGKAPQAKVLPEIDQLWCEQKDAMQLDNNFFTAGGSAIPAA